jgi:hypothetical protein
MKGPKELMREKTRIIMKRQRGGYILYCATPCYKDLMYPKHSYRGYLGPSSAQFICMLYCRVYSFLTILL